jgi:hypothetical protein
MPYSLPSSPATGAPDAGVAGGSRSAASRSTTRVAPSDLDRWCRRGRARLPFRRYSDGQRSLDHFRLVSRSTARRRSVGSSKRAGRRGQTLQHAGERAEIPCGITVGARGHRIILNSN